MQIQPELPVRLRSGLLPTRSNPNGSHFQIGNTRLYIGPDPRGSSYPPVLAYHRDGMPDPAVLARFKSDAEAGAAVEALNIGIDELNNLHRVQVASGISKVAALVMNAITPMLKPRGKRTFEGDSKALRAGLRDIKKRLTEPPQ